MLTAQGIRELPSGEWVGISADNSADPTPYETVLSLALVHNTGDLLRVSVDGDQLQIFGPPRAMQAVADILDLVARDGDHAHLEWYPQHLFLDAEAIPMVISRRKSDAG